MHGEKATSSPVRSTRLLSIGVASTLALLMVTGCDRKPPDPVPLPPTVTRFEAQKSHLVPGEAVQLTFVAENATAAMLVDAAGAPIPLEGEATSGSATVTPAATTFYVLRVEGPGGRDTAFVQVAVGADLGEVFLAAVPGVIDSGGVAQLLWSAPGASSIKLTTNTAASIPVDVSAGAGVVEVRPEASTVYTLAAQGAAGASTATAEVQVRPVLRTFEVSPQAALPGQSLSLSWKTGNAEAVVIAERTFGEVVRAGPGEELPAAEGALDWMVPTTLPNGVPVTEGQPLEFTITVTQSAPAVTLTRVVKAWIGSGPEIRAFDVPNAVPEGKPFSISWNVANAVRVQLFADGALIYEPLPGSAGISSASLVLAAPTEPTRYELVAYSFVGARLSKERLVRAVKPPRVDSFNLPALIDAAGIAASATWTTRDAAGVSIRVKNGPTVFTTVEAAKVASGSAPLFPGLKATFVLEAWNDAGELATLERTVDVNQPQNVSSAPSTVVVPDPVSVSWAISDAVELIGDPTAAPLKSNPSGSFLDLALEPLATKVLFSDAGEAVAQLELPGPFRFPLAGVTQDKYWVSTNGFVAFTPPTPNPGNTLLSAANANPAMIAPFWDDLNLGTQGEVLYMVDGASFPRRLIIQWNKVQTATDLTSELTFQVQLLESGEFRFAYQTLSGTNSLGESASIGWRLNPSLSADFGIVDAPVLLAGDELVWLLNPGSSGTVSFNPPRGAQLTLFGLSSSGKYVVYPAPMNVIAPGDVRLNEAMILPDPFTMLGQWIELANVTDREIDLSGAVLATNASSWTLPAGTLIPARGFLVLGQSYDPIETGGVVVDLVWNGLAPDPAQDDGIVLSVGGKVISVLGYAATALTAGTAIGSESVLDDTGASVWCGSLQTFGPTGATGTPGARNELCFDYQLTTIPGDFEDVSANGTPLIANTGLHDTQATITLPTPFPWFGSPQPLWTVSSNGWLAPTTLGSSVPANKLRPNTAVPVGAIAPFWDDLAFASGNIYQRRIETAGGRPGYTILQWSHVRINNVTPNDWMGFEVKLFDDGVIELHYGTLFSGNPNNYAAGSSATVWIENPSGTRAQAVGINEAVLASGRAWRFTPKSLVQP